MKLGNHRSIGLNHLLSETYQLTLLRVARHLVRRERRHVRLERLRALLRHRVQLHVTLH